MKIAIYSPYLDTFGGGERYMMTIAEIFSLSSFDISVLLDRHLSSLGANYLKNELSERFDLNLSKAKFISGPIGEGSDFFSRFFFLKKYDILFYLTDGSIFNPTAKKNILHIQSPLVGQPSKSGWGKIKLNGWDLIIYNSHFTKQHSEKNWPLVSNVVYPPVDTNKIESLKKEKIILSVGRFFGYLKDKKQEVLIKIFKELYTENQIDGWTLCMVGSAGEGDKSYLQNLRKTAEGLPIKFYPNLEYDELIKLYGKSSIYWHAAGFGEADPTKMEHFGITTVEAMAGGVVPVVIGKGGQIEIVGHKISGFLWKSTSELKSFTLKLIKDKNLRIKMSKNAIKKSKDFSKEKFKEKMLKLARL